MKYKPNQEHNRGHKTELQTTEISYNPDTENGQKQVKHGYSKHMDVKPMPANDWEQFHFLLVNPIKSLEHVRTRPDVFCKR